MRILALSDSHRDVFSLQSAIEAQPSADIIVFLGDGENDIDQMCRLFPHKPIVCVGGNCDFSRLNPETRLIPCEGVKIFCTHGHRQMVKYGTERLMFDALKAGADIALYGHTHIQDYEYVNGLHLFNPGSIRDGRYGVIDINPSGINCIKLRLPE
ncbi:MAG: YfcE family phosphodiesterase [Clostridiales bacterium]|nr:YfcE family phosphodiesterase [Clostridiales bacterium]